MAAVRALVVGGPASPHSWGGQGGGGVPRPPREGRAGGSFPQDRADGRLQAGSRAQLGEARASLRLGGLSRGWGRDWEMGGKDLAQGWEWAASRHLRRTAGPAGERAAPVASSLGRPQVREGELRAASQLRVPQPSPARRDESSTTEPDRMPVGGGEPVLQEGHERKPERETETQRQRETQG